MTQNDPESTITKNFGQNRPNPVALGEIRGGKQKNENSQMETEKS